MYHVTRNGGSTSMICSVDSEEGRRRKPGRIGACSRQRAAGASPRRSGVTPATPGHQSDRWCGSARKSHTSSSGASSSLRAA
jgi:hypothetical protein